MVSAPAPARLRVEHVRTGVRSAEWGARPVVEAGRRASAGRADRFEGVDERGGYAPRSSTPSNRS
ncbi:MAG TPA: hypothetical protein VM324_09405, partial [Egibacteraceae bacterium]|nr:hypothetical protein [Egibacteraceae bacterium]